MDSFPVPFHGKKEVRVLGVLGKRCLCVLRSIYLVEVGVSPSSSGLDTYWAGSIFWWCMLQMHRWGKEGD